MTATIQLPKRWYSLRKHAEQQAFFNARERFIVAVAGRRSGKTEIAKRRLVRDAMSFHKHAAGKFVLAAPTRDQAKRIYWEDLKELVPSRFIADILETELLIRLVTGTRIQVVGMDKPERAEGEPIDGCVLDEFADMKPRAFTASIRPALSTVDRPGWAIFIGKPKGRNHFYQLYNRARFQKQPGWIALHWKSSSVIDPEEDAAAKRELDPLTYAQEYDADFVNFEGRVYYPFTADTHAKEPLSYDETTDLVFAFDFNVSPGVAVVCQEQRYQGQNPKVAGEITAVIGEVWIPQNSNTPAVCRKLIADWGKHKGHVYLYGDATGGSRGSAKVAGSDWELIEAELRPVFRDRMHLRVPRANPHERVRVNAMNARLLTADGRVRMLVDPARAPHVVEDLEGVVALEGGSGEIDKIAYPMLTHVSDALGYYVERRHPLVSHVLTSEDI